MTVLSQLHYLIPGIWNDSEGEALFARGPKHEGDIDFQWDWKKWVKYPAINLLRIFKLKE